MILIVDNYDSFTFNLVQYFGQLGATQRVFRNNEITPAEALELNPDRVLLSPGPCSPQPSAPSSPSPESCSPFSTPSSEIKPHGRPLDIHDGRSG